MEKGRGCYEENRDWHLVQSNGICVNRTMEMNGTSSSEDLSSFSLCSGLGYIEHPVSRFDTLAGIAIKYGVEVSDIKRMNALVTDQQMFALKSLQIPTPGKHPSPPLSEDIDIFRKSTCEQGSTRLTSFNLLDSFPSLRIKPSTLKTTLQPHQANVPAICELTSYSKGEFDQLGSHPKLASSHNPHGSHHRKSRSFANGFHMENIEFTDIITAPNGAADSIKGSEKLCRRRQKSMADFSTATESILNKTYATNNGECLSITRRSLDLRLKGALGRTNAASNGVTELSKLTPNLTDDMGGDSSFMRNGILGRRRSSSTCNLQEADIGNASSSSKWSTSWSLKSDLQAFSSAMVTKSIFEGLPKSGSTRYKASMD